MSVVITSGILDIIGAPNLIVAVVPDAYEEPKEIIYAFFADDKSQASIEDTQHLPFIVDYQPQRVLPEPILIPTALSKFQVNYENAIRHITQANKRTIIDIFDIIKTRTGKNYKDIRGISDNLAVIRAQKLIIALFLKNQLNKYLLCFYLKIRDWDKISELWCLYKNDHSLINEAELMQAIICGRITGIVEPVEGVHTFGRHLDAWLCTLSCIQRKDVFSYVQGTLTNVSSRVDRMSCIRGLYLLSQDPHIRGQVIHYLSLSGLSSYVGLIEPQIRRAGYSLKAA